MVLEAVEAVEVEAVEVVVSLEADSSVLPILLVSPEPFYSGYHVSYILCFLYCPKAYSAIKTS